MMVIYRYTLSFGFDKLLVKINNPAKIKDQWFQEYRALNADHQHIR